MIVAWCCNVQDIGTLDSEVVVKLSSVPFSLNSLTLDKLFTLVLVGQRQCQVKPSLLLRPGSGAEYCDQFVCLCVCLSVREHISGTAGPIFTKFCMQIPCGCGSVFLWRRCNALFTSGFMDGVTFGLGGPYGDA